MAKKSMTARQKKREQLVLKYKARRDELRRIVKRSASVEEVMDAQLKLAKLPVNSSPVRLNTRCQQCGRIHAVYKKFGLCRICLRQQLMTGNVPGGRKSSW